MRSSVRLFAAFDFAVIVLLPTAACLAKDVYVSPNGSAEGDGSRAQPLNLETALGSTKHVGPGDTVWLNGGTYRGAFQKPAEPSGTLDRPIVYRANPGERVTLTAKEDDRYVLELAGAEHVWFWGFEVTVGGRSDLGHYGAGVSLRGGREIKLINLVIHDCPNRSGIGGSNLGSEFYGCLIYRNGQWANALAHGTYTQNRPEDVGGDLDKLPWKVHRDCVVFNNFGWGVHSYATSPKLANLLFEGVVAYGNGLPQGATKPCPNFLAGGQKFDDQVVLRDCCTYYPDRGNFKRGADLGYGGENGRLKVEGCCFVGGEDAIWVRKWQEATITRCMFLTPNGHALRLIRPADFQPSRYHWDGNTYYRLAAPLVQLDDTPFADLATWQAATGLDKTSRMVDGRPAEPWLCLRPNRYEPEKAFLVVYNWPRKSAVEVPMGKLWGLKAGEQYTVLNVEDVWGKPTAEGHFSGDTVPLPMVGSYAPEFACYVLVRRSGHVETKLALEGKSR